MDIDILNLEELDLLCDIIDDSQKIVILAHVNPDGDAVGSSLGFMQYLMCYKKDVSVIVPDQYPNFLHWLPYSDKIIRYDRAKERANALIKNADTIFFLDFNSLSRVEAMSSAVEESKAKRVLVDHHENPEVKVDLCISHPEMSSTSEIVFRLIWQMQGSILIDEPMATALYCGMMTDTGGFTYNSNSPELYFIISQLLCAGIDKDKIYRSVYNNYSESRMRLLGYILYEKLHVLDDYHAAYYTISRDDMSRFKFKKGDAEGIVNFPLQISGIRLSISLREDTDKDNLVWVSLRSVGDFSCISMAEKFFNGGGHFNASGGRLYCSLAEAENTVKLAILHFEKELRS